MKYISIIINVLFLLTIACDVIFLDNYRINNAYKRGYTEAMTDACNMLDSSAQAMKSQPDTTTRIYIDGKDTTRSITITH